MKRAVAAAFVLIVGAAVVLWYGNTLNSWVLGGLIGGLAALLLSIPISLTLFSFFAHRHDQRFRAVTYEQEQSEAAFLRRYDYAAIPAPLVQEVDDAYDDEERAAEEMRYQAYGYDVVDADASVSERVAWQEERARQLPPASSYRRLPAPRIGQPLDVPVERAREGNRRRDTASQRERSVSATRPPADKEKGSTRRPAPRQSGAMGFPGYQTNASRYRSEALRTARLKAAEQRAYAEDDPIAPPSTSRRTLPRRLGQAHAEHPEPGQRPRSTYGSSQPEHYSSRSGSKSAVTPPQYGARRVSRSAEDEALKRAASHARESDPQTEYLTPDMTTEDLRRPLVRRAPYMYEDDPLLQEMAQHVEAPITRRSSRYLKSRRQQPEE